MSAPSPEIPPVYELDTREALSFIAIWVILGIIVVNALLYVPGAASLGFFVGGSLFAGWWWYTVPGRVHEWKELREFKKSIPDSPDTK